MSEDAAPANSSTKGRKGRSPSYPALALDVAVARAQQLYDAERRNAAPISGIQVLWGFKANTGPANLAVAALKKYGLITDSGSGTQRVAQLSQLGYEVLHNPDPEARQAAIRKAALNPPIHQAVWERYAQDGLPSDATLRYELVSNRAFTETGATEFISQFRKTVAYANLAGGASMDSIDDDPADEDEGGGDEAAGEAEQVLHQRARRRKSPGAEQGVLSIPVPVIGGKPVTIEGQFPISEAAWDQFLAVLQAMKPGLVAGVEEED